MPEPMDAARWTAVQTLFEAALDCSPAERDAFLRAACVNADGVLDADLYAEVASLVNVEVHSLLRGLAVDAVDLPAMLSMEGERVGPYRIVRELGRGGMGIVYLAERDDGAYEQAVALKLVKRGMDSESIVRRFQQERQILARLAHPGIARLLDGGLADDGRPYFAMEVVEGEPITAYCDARALGVGARLALFERVCDAVAYAHTRLIVHRDLKPSNILITDGEAGPEVKLLDFGIARLLEHDGPGLTWSGLRPMTPEYAAPEQVRGEPVTTAADVYALGTLLYELLAGRRPHALDRKDPRALEAAILDAEPPRPSLAVRQAVTIEGDDGPRAVTPEGVAHTRATTPERLTRRLAGDLDTITLKALAKEPDARYSSAEALADDVRRHRRGIPVEARRATAGYRVRKFVMRHRVGVATAAGIVAVLAAVIGFYTARLAAERDRAQLEAAKATQVAAFLGGVFQSADPNETRGDSALVRDVLDRGAARIGELADQPDVQAALLHVVGEVYTTLERYDRADSLLSASLGLRRTLGSPPEEVAAVAVSLARLRDYTGDYAAADSLFRLALALQRGALGPDHPDVAVTLHGLGAVHYRLGRYAEADSLFDAALTIQLQHFGADALEFAPTYDFLGILADEMDDVDAADSLAQRALAIRRAHLAPPHAELAESLLNAGLAKRTLRRYDEAEAYYLEALAMRRALYGEQHSDVAHSLNHLASLHYNRGDYDAAERYAREGYAIRLALHGPHHVEVGASLGNLARIQEARGDLDGAEQTLRQNLALIRATVGPEHPYVGATLYRLGRIDEAQGRLAEAEAAYREALALYRAVWPDGNQRVGDACHALGALLAERRPAEAEPLLRESLRLRRADWGDDDVRTARTRGALGLALARTNQTEEAERALEDALRVLRAAGTDTTETQRFFDALAVLSLQR
ncbi:MAG: serine/threonine-protein kinase [Rhodothermales bacterium]